jgi:(E)-4-hydroxy-3-methylbut-2-enyl-diphosphate synthase
MVGNVPIGGDAPISVQTMAKTPTANVAATIAQIRAIEEAGCHLVRVGVPDEDAARALGAIVRGIGIPLVADIQFDYRLAMIAIEQGIHKLRLNPGNLHNPEKVRDIVMAARERGVPIRVGVNNGSVPQSIRDRHEKNPEGNARALIACALEHLTILEDLDFTDIVVSLKASDIRTTVLAYRLMAAMRDYPLHVGVTEAGPAPEGLIKSAVGMGQLLGEGLGNTIRVSLTGHPVDEVEAGWHLLRSLDLREGGITLTSCPKCARCDVDFEPIVYAVKERLHTLDRVLRHAGISLHVAVMGCEVNGPGEARNADVGLASGVNAAALFVHGAVVRKVPESEMVETLVHEVEAITRERLAYPV